MTELSYATVASCILDEWLEAKKAGIKVSAETIIRKYYSLFSEKLDCPNEVFFKGTIFKILNGWKWKRKEEVPANTTIQTEHYIPASEGNGLQFVLNQINELGLNQDSYF